jgi:hypothetical protein
MTSPPLHHPSFFYLLIDSVSLSLHLLFFRTWKQWVGDTVVVMSFNRTNLRMMFIMAAIFFCVGEGLFGVMYFNTVAKVS